MFTKRSIFFFFIISISLSVAGQSIKVKKETARIKNEYADGFEIELQATAEEVEAALAKWMKSFGKTKSNDNFTAVSEPTIMEKKYTAPVYALTKQVGNIVSAWVGIESSDWSKKDAEEVSKELEKLIYDFGVNFYREKIQRQIDESLRASQAVERQQQRLQNQNRDLTTRIEANKREKIQLEKSLENNRVELETLTKRLEKNKKDQDSVAVAGDQIKKVVEMHKEKQRKVN
jgi:hypothetical protein